MNKSRLVFFDSLRSIAIVGVLLHHMNSTWMGGGYLGVYVFFPISGYLIARTYLTSGAIQFYIKRFFRIYIPYIAAVFIWTYFAISTGKHTLPDLMPVLFDHLTFTKVHSTLGYGTAVLWTLQAEAWFYVIAPLILVFRKDVASVIFLCLAVYAFCSRTGIVSPFRLEPFKYTISYMDNFAVGVLLAIWIDKLPSLPFSRFIVGSALLTILILFFMPIKGAEFDQEIRTLVAVLSGLIIWGCLKNDIQMDVPILQWIGIISYSLYLLHGTILDFRLYIDLRGFVSELGVYSYFGITARLTQGNIFVLFSILCIVSATISYFLFERTGAYLGKRIAASYKASRQVPF